MKKLNILFSLILITSQLFAQRNDIAVKINVSTSNYTGSLQNGAWSPDNQKIMCTNWAGGYNQLPANIFIIDLSNNSITEMTTDGESNVNMPGQTWSVATNKILFSSEHNGNGDQAHIMSPSDAPGTAVKITPFTDRMCWEPGFSPDGEYIVYEAHYVNNDQVGVIETYKIDNTQNPVTLTDSTTVNAKQPTWSPLGDKIAYQVFDGNVWNIWTMNIDGSNKQNITGTDAGDKTDATFSPNGEWIVYSSNNGALNYANIFIKNLTTGQLLQVTDYPNGYDGAPSWGTNNKIIFESTVGEPDTSSGATLWTIDAPINGTVGIESITGNNNSSIYPNPAKDFITIELKNMLQNETKISIYNLQGELMINKTAKSEKVNIDISSLPEGVYFVKIINDKGIKSLKIIKQ